jgi:phage terminase large subunit GpA-like protein
MLAVTEPGVHTITAMVCTQLLKTSLIINTFGYFAHLDPCPMLLVQPKDEAAESFSKERIGPTIKATPVLKAIVGTEKTRDSEETIKFKAFLGGFLAITSAGSPTNLASRPIRVTLFDEIDKYEPTREGDPITIGEERTARFGANWLSIRACSPTVEDDSRIAASYAESDRRRASLACPHCGHRMFPEFFKHVDWQKERDANGNVVRHLWKTAQIHCEACGCAWSEGDRLRALKTARWHQTRPFECCGERHVPLELHEKTWREGDEDGAVDKAWDWWEDKVDGRYAVYRAKCPTCGKWGVDNAHAGFQASKLYSPWQKDRPQDIAKKWLDAKGDQEKELAWWNTQAGMPHRPAASKNVDVETLLSRREVFAGAVPSGVAVITVGIDTQDYRVEIETVGWGKDEESWSIDYHVIEGEFSDPKVQAQLDAYLKRVWVRADGRPLEVMASCQDSGGHHTQDVYNFSKARLGRRNWAIKGASEKDGARNPVWPTKKPSKRNKASFRPIVIGGNTARDQVRNRLLLEPPPVGQSKPGYSHFPADRDVGYFEQLIADKLVSKKVGHRVVRVWETPSGKANEAADCRVYAYAALCGLNHLGLQLNRRVESMSAPPAMADGVAQVVTQNEPRQFAQPTQAAHSPSAPTPQKRSLVARLA